MGFAYKITDQQSIHFITATVVQWVDVFTRALYAPNPTNKDLFINNESWKQNDKAIVEVFDMLGKSLLRKDFSQAKDIVPFEKCAPGTYMVYYYLNEQPAQVWKVVKL